MIKVFKNNKLVYKNKVYKCSLGINGLNHNKIEGDGCTPTGIFLLGKIYFRDDKIKNLQSKIETNIIEKNMYWSDDPNNSNYNNLINKKLGKYEKLYRKDSIYDILIVINFNMKPIIKGKGSAIFLHVAKKNFSPTKGCIALNKKDLKEIIFNLELNERIEIISRNYKSA